MKKDKFRKGKKQNMGDDSWYDVNEKFEDSYQEERRNFRKKQIRRKPPHKTSYWDD